MLSSRFTEYGLTGTFFIITQILLFYNLHDSRLYDQIITGIGNFHNSIGLLSSDNTSSLLTALAFVSVFVIGLSLDLMGSVFLRREMECLSLEIKKNTTWLDGFVEKNSEYMADDYAQILNNFRDTKMLTSLFSHIKTINNADRVRSFFISYVLTHLGNDKSQILIEQIHLWRTGRVISVIIWIFSAEILLMEYLSSSFSYATFAIILISLMVATYLAKSAYQRMLTTLFSLMYISTKENTKYKAIS